MLFVLTGYCDGENCMEMKEPADVRHTDFPKTPKKPEAGDLSLQYCKTSVSTYVMVGCMSISGKKNQFENMGCTSKEESSNSGKTL